MHSEFYLAAVYNTYPIGLLQGPVLASLRGGGINESHCKADQVRNPSRLSHALFLNLGFFHLFLIQQQLFSATQTQSDFLKAFSFISLMQLFLCTLIFHWLLWTVIKSQEQGRIDPRFHGVWSLCNLTALFEGREQLNYKYRIRHKYHTYSEWEEKITSSHF